jgi:hypothetical protein
MLLRHVVALAATMKPFLIEINNPVHGLVNFNGHQEEGNKWAIDCKQ